MNRINILEMNKILDHNSSLFLCGNGFSINFDNDFGNIFDRIYEAHKVLIHNGKYTVEKHTNIYFKKKCLDNYKNVLQYIRYFSEDELKNIFKDGYKFAKSIIENKIILEELEKNDLINKLTFDRSQLNLLYEIANIESEESINKVNIEYWSILIYFYFAIKSLNSSNYKFPLNNSFLLVIYLGDVNKNTFIKDRQIKSIIQESTLFNGFNTYYRLLFCTAIFSNGKGIELSKLNKLSNLSMPKITNFLNRYNSIMTLNYDNILDIILPNKNISHLHGKFVNKEEYVHSQSLALKYDNGNKCISFSDILIGDYFYNKTQREVINHLATKNYYNKTPEYISNIIRNEINNNNINTIVIFGMNVQNDQHVIRNIMLEFFYAKIQNPEIIYCYYCDKEAEYFLKEFYKVITFNDEAAEYAKNIKVRCIDTHTILKSYF
ncbi:hypothetical protein [Clostridium tyrobutyricum]|uniref:hypothetical protein n=1 Tax=Clostridium tyrobutyricum TaxID=1519 RepID=UPI001C394C37|nr:hypothetical protein [Clostridium tyrobutyricum]MBV4414671.1 hypothetical protein [Clostridium tyrobutyricum]